mmetsp:Transcript_22045/g.61184  ORF Transcript_22045/g.61184 Transcript_22045/m.61184 type:complete len:774 (-) Transcript_22045:119-2440(-)|eukprot:CAMPEP_0117669210 /NCGR_PEP_ID=MMETSP0804-20121206/11996_1 /TAXON_ID=1074897 /ORGANISM="Tetraselmis astigmatica, Strain CCMP880" /LENGTH=773 /DNA_ID=CAMNT_0005477223 /DNA_START=156 /DNA_END=2477 /DNA_ORIENTATION=+
MFAKLASYAGIGSALPFALDSAAGPYAIAWGGWTHQPGTWREDGSAVSVFRLAAPKNDRALDAARNGAKRLRTMRHPNMLSFKDTAEVEERNETVIYIVTEPVKPLKLVLDDLALEGTQKDQYLAMGLYHVAGAISFLNNDAGLIHGNVCMAAIVVTPKLDWKLHGLDLLSEHSMEVQPPPLSAANWMIGGQYIPGEVAKSDWSAVSQGPPWGVDAWGTGCLMHEVYANSALQKIEELRDTSCIPEGLMQDYQRLLSSQPTRRLNPAKLVSESGFLRNSLVNTVAFLENLSVKDSSEKDQFFRKLPGQLPSFPQPLCVNKFLPLLQSALEYGGAPPIALSAVLKIGNTLEPEEIQARVIPIVTKLFTSQERAIRKSLLENIELFGPHLTEKVCENQIYPEVAKGFTDSNEYLRELTLRSMLTLAPKLSQRTLNNSLLKYLAKLQVDEKPGIRANTTVLLGNLAPHLGDVACKRVLLNAFTRALKDSFPPARVAAIKALVATAEKHSAEESAQRIMPAVAAFTVDPIKDVRKAAIQCIDLYMRQLKNHAAEMDKRDEAVEAAGAASGGVAGGPPQPAIISREDSGSSGYLSWASSFMGSSKGPEGAPSAAAAGVADKQPAVGSAAPAAVAPLGYTPPAPTTSAAAPIDEDAGNGWGDDDDILEGLDNQENDAERQARERMERLRMKSTAKPKTKPSAADDLLGELAVSSGMAANQEDLFEDLMADATEAVKRPVKPRAPRPASAAKTSKSKPMKLGASKLGAQKLPPAAGDSLL